MNPLSLASLLLVANLLPTQDDAQRAELLASPEYAEAAASPSFQELDVEELRGLLRVVAARNEAFFGFNTPELQVHLPLIDNSTYAEIEMGEPRLVDAAGNDVPHEIERGLHDTETQIDEVRFLAADGESPAEFARAQGEIRLRYPLEIATRSVAASDGDAVVSIDGPFVEILEGRGVAEAPSFSELDPVRAFDAGARRLARSKSYFSSRFEDDMSWRGLAFHGAVARVEVDSVERWVELVVRYDVPIAEPLPESRQGMAAEDPRDVAADPNAMVEVEVASAAAPGGATSEVGARLAQALSALEEAAGGSLSVVQLMVFPEASMVTVSTQAGGVVEEFGWSNGEVTGPSEVDTQWLQCKEGMSPDALPLESIPRIWEDAVARGSGGSPLQMVVGQHPCGTAWINVSLDTAQQLQYAGDGSFVGPQ